MGVVVDQAADRMRREYCDLVVERAEPGGVGVELLLGVSDEDGVDVLLFRQQLIQGVLIGLHLIVNAALWRTTQAELAGRGFLAGVGRKR